MATHANVSRTQMQQQAASLRMQIRQEQFRESTSGLSSGMVQANIVILPADWADDFLKFCQRNPIPCPLLAMSAPGEFLLNEVGHNLDIRTDVPEYQVYRDGVASETRYNLSDVWQDDFVTFVLGCSFSFEEALMASGLSIRNIDMGRNVSMFKTNIATQAAGRFYGNTVVTMRPFSARDCIRAIQITSRFPKAHGAPIHLGDPALIGISNLETPDFGDPVPVAADEIPVFWACGVTPQLAIMQAKPPICITHVPGKMLVTDLLNAELSLL